MKSLYKTSETCSVYIGVELDGEVIKRVEFMGGCEGNLKGISKLVAGMTVDDAVDKLAGITCGKKRTSCPDQLAKALLETREKARMKDLQASESQGQGQEPFILHNKA